MPSTFSPDLRIELMANGGNTGTWGTITNTNLGTLIEDAISGLASVSITSAAQALTVQDGAADQARCAAFDLTTTTTAAFSAFVPPVTKLYVVKNSSIYTATVYASTVSGNTTPAGTGVAIPAGRTVAIRCDGTNIVDQLNYISSNLTVAGNQAVTGTLAVTGTSTFTGSAAFSGVPTAPTASAGTNTTQIATTAFVTTAAGAAVPSGSLLMWPTASAPSGYLLCNGAAVSRTTYAALFAVVGTVFGAGDTTTTFNLPDYRDRMPIGAGTTYSPNSQGGSANAITVTHTHSLTDPGHFHSADGTNGANNFPALLGFDGTFDAVSRFATNQDAAYINGSRVGTASTGISIAASGSSGTNANLPPYLGIYFIIKT
jgi:microcystin-dependent protein